MESNEETSGNTKNQVKTYLNKLKYFFSSIFQRINVFFFSAAGLRCPTLPKSLTHRHHTETERKSSTIERGDEGLPVQYIVVSPTIPVSWTL